MSLTSISTRLVMTASSLFMAILGLSASFLPHEIARKLGATGEPAPLALGIQLLGALYLAFGILNWFAKDSLIGGIYNRPVAMGNFLHFLMGALALGKAAFAGQTAAVIVSFAALYSVFAVAFGMIVFTSPVKPAA